MRTEVGFKCQSCAEAPTKSRSRRVGAGVLVVGAALFLVAGVAGSRLVSSPRRPGVPAPVGAWTGAGSLSALRGGTTGLQLGDGRVLVVGGGVGRTALAATELFDPSSATWSRTGDLHRARRGNSAVLLADGRVLTSGGVDAGTALGSTEVYDPATGAWTEAAPMHQARVSHTLTALADGRVLASGGAVLANGTAVPQASAELFDPAAGEWTPLPVGMAEARFGAQAVLLPGGRVLVAGGLGAGAGGPTALASAELFDPAVAAFARAAAMSEPRQDLAATPLADGRVLVTGGSSSDATATTAEVFDPRTAQWSPTTPMGQARRRHPATRRVDGRVLVVAGEVVDGGTRTSLRSAELFDPATATWAPAALLGCPRSAQAQVTLASGAVLVVGGDASLPGAAPQAQSCAELFRLS